MESYPDPTLPSRPPSYPYFFDSVVIPESPPEYQDDNFTLPQLFPSSENQGRGLEDDGGRGVVLQHPCRALGDTTASQSMPPPALPQLRKHRRVESHDVQWKRQRLPAVGVFRPPEPPKARARSPLRVIKNIQNANFTTKNQANVLATLAQTKSTIFYKENSQGKLVIQKYSHQRTDSSLAAVHHKLQNTHKPSTASSNLDQQLIQALTLPFPPVCRSPSNQQSTSDHYTHNLYRAFERDFEDSSIPRMKHLPTYIDPQDLTMENSDNQKNREGNENNYFDSSAPPPSAPMQNDFIQKRPQAPQPGQQHVAMAHIIRQGTARGLASGANYDPDVLGKRKVKKGDGHGHGVREFVELMNHEGRDDANQDHDIAMTCPRFSDPPLAEMDTIPDEDRVSASSLGADGACIGGFAPAGTFEDSGRDASHFANSDTRTSSPMLGGFNEEVYSGQQQHQNPFAFSLGEHLVHPHLSTPCWDGNDLAGFPIHLSEA